MNSDRSDFVSAGDPTLVTSYFRAGVRPCRSHVKRKRISPPGCTNSMFLHIAQSFLRFPLQKRKTTINNTSKKHLEVDSIEYMLGLM